MVTTNTIMQKINNDIVIIISFCVCAKLIVCINVHVLINFFIHWECYNAAKTILNNNNIIHTVTIKNFVHLNHIVYSHYV